MQAELQRQLSCCNMYRSMSEWDLYLSKSNIKFHRFCYEELMDPFH